MGGLPEGTVTFLFSDIEGSTSLLERIGDEAFELLLSEHRTLLRDAFTSHRGLELGTEGDSFFVVFASAVDGVRAAVAGQRALIEWDGGVRVRMGLHTGEGRPEAEGYVGIDVHRAARIASAANGGQVLLSETTAALVRDLPAGCSLTDLGPHRLKDLSRPIRLFELVHPTLPGASRPPRTLSRRRHNLPVLPTPFLGRERELREVEKLVEQSRLVTLTGPGGTGKTRLSLQAAAELSESFPDGVWFVELATLRDPALIGSKVAAALDLAEPERLIDDLMSRRALLVLDNVEHLLGVDGTVADFVSGLVRSCPEVHALATSRQPLRLSAESVYPVPGLDVSNEDGVLEGGQGSDAVRLFIDRARSADPSFAVDHAALRALVQICARLDGMPLGIELAAARVRLLGVQGLAAGLEESLSVLGAGPDDAPERHRTLDATIAWSWDLLDDRLRHVLMRASVFRGGFDLAAAEQVCGAGLEDLARLVDASLIVRLETADLRWDLLDTVRAYARGRLMSSGSEPHVRGRHSATFATLVREARAGVGSPRGPEWVRRVITERPNILAAAEYLAQADPSRGVELLADLAEVLTGRSGIEEVRARLLAARGRFALGTLERARVDVSLASIGDREDGPWVEPLMWAKDAAERAGDERLEALTLLVSASRVGTKESKSATRSFMTGFMDADPHDSASTDFERVFAEDPSSRLARALELAERIGDPSLANAIRRHPMAGKTLRSLVRATAGHESVLRDARERGDLVGVSEILGRSAPWGEDAIARAEEALDLARRMGDRTAEAQALSMLSSALVRDPRRERLDEGIAGTRQALALARAEGSPALESKVLREMISVAALLGDSASIDRIGSRLRVVGVSGSGPVVGAGKLAALRTRATGLVGMAACIAWIGGSWPSSGRGWLLVLGGWSLSVRAVRHADVGSRLRYNPFAMPALAAFAVGLPWRSAIPGAVSNCVLLGLVGSRRRNGIVLRILNVVVALVVLAALAVAPTSWPVPTFLMVLAATSHLYVGHRAWLASAVRASARVLREGTVLLVASVMFRWAIGDAVMPLAAWEHVATWGAVAGASAFGVVVAAASRAAAVGGLLVAVSAAFQPWALANPSPAATVAMSVFALGWALLTLRLRRGYLELAACRPLYGDTEAAVGSDPHAQP